MKLIYQHMLGFLLIIFTTIGIIGVAEINYVTNQTYDANYQRLEGYAKSIGQLALEQGNDGQAIISSTFLNKLQLVMKKEDVNLRIFDQNNQQVYPEINPDVSLSAPVFRAMKTGHSLQIKNDHKEMNQPFSGKDAYTSVLVPWFEKRKLVGAIWIGSRVNNVERPIAMAKKSLFNALLITLLVGLILSYFLSFYSVSKIKRLSKATKKVAAGDFDVQIKNKNSDEIDQLASNFNAMVKALKKSNDEVQEQERRRDQFMADAAHEMRTPLTTINGILEGLQYDAIPEESKPKSIELMQHETKRLIRLVNENLDYEKIRNNQINLIKSNFNASKTLKDLQAQLAGNAQKNNDELLVKVPAELPIYADSDRFTQIMVNLIQNAIQFTKDGKIEVAGQRLEHAARFTVKDNGIGMSQEQMKYIFERFFKADPSRVRAGTGESGLGLAIVASLVKQHGGKINVASKEGQGSTFTLTIFDKGFEQYEL
jgi:signal transduction histidine kinase